MAIDRDFDPAGREAQDRMRAMGTDPAFARLQQSFRARLTPKPWRCGAAAPPGQYPRDGEELRRRFAAWVSAYERASAGYATCRYVETAGSGRPSRSAEGLVAVHDRVTRCTEALPLA